MDAIARRTTHDSLEGQLRCLVKMKFVLGRLLQRRSGASCRFRGPDRKRILTLAGT